MVTKNVSNTGAMSDQTATTGATGASQNIVGGGLSPLGGSGISPGGPAIAGGGTGGGSGQSFLANTGSFLESLMHGLSSLDPFPGAIGKGIGNAIKGKGQTAKVPASTTPTPVTPGTTAAGAPTTKPLIDPMAMKLFFSTIIGPYLDQIVQQQNASADQLGSQMQHALSDFSIPENARGLLESSSAQAQADIRNVGQTQRAAAASAPDLAAFMAQLQSSQNSQELSRLEQQRVLAAQGTANGTAATDPAIQAIIDSLTNK